ncbi:hypothetical protein QVG61_01735 [Thiohalobacter sp. IOR34]|uniref:hypothetical protein n=1 Tax=Thiohalobacter sp. IOR34 TaxID=3057176 RepID=UPI0025B0DD0E|nr:hypothetical protein [Thiohalobacter sp. IOR34]WJW75835.1 hypothetical protein QVG61_01735 [Thiohalobacter sp. IOR34]
MILVLDMTTGSPAAGEDPRQTPPRQERRGLELQLQPIELAAPADRPGLPPSLAAVDAGAFVDAQAED